MCISRKSFQLSSTQHGCVRFDVLHGWLTAKIYRHGRKFTPAELVKRATGAPMSIAPYLSYLRGKYGEFYRLPATTAPVPAA